MKIFREIVIASNLILGLFTGYVYGAHIEPMSIGKHIAITLVFSILATVLFVYTEYCVARLIQKRQTDHDKNGAR